MRRSAVILITGLLLISNELVIAQENLEKFDDKSVTVLNEELRKLRDEIRTVQSSITPGKILQQVSNIADSTFGPSANLAFGAVATGNTATPFDDTIPQNTEGNLFMTKAITPLSSTSKLRIDVTWYGASNSGGTPHMIASLHRDGGAALAAISNVETTANVVGSLTFTHVVDSSSTAATTFTVRVGDQGANTVTMNGSNGARVFGGVCASSMVITEYEP